jgi:eukaryotic-like serine/threonine-protein kinase
MPRLSDEQWRSFSDHLGQALALPQAEQTAWLARLARTHPQVAAEIERKLSVRNRAGFVGFLTDPLLPPAREEGASRIGRQVGRYLIEALIARGSAGSVWRARVLDGPIADGRREAQVAIQFVPTYWLGRTGVARLRGEGAPLGRPEHPHIARLIGSGLFDDSQPYLMVEYVDGEPMDRYCERAGLDVRARVRLFRQALGAVEQLHGQLIIHRALKPANILVTPAGDVKLLDCALARLRSEDAGAAATQTYALTLLPQYAAPEQLSGGPITTRTDIYALGLVLYRLLTGTPAVSIEGGSHAELIARVIREVQPIASIASGVTGSWRRQLRGDLDHILAMALQKDAGHRYESVRGFGDDLQRYLAHQPVRARTRTVGYRLAKFVRRIMS